MASIELTFTVDGTRYEMRDIPVSLWTAFDAAARRQYPNLHESAWSTYLGEVLMAAGTGETAILSEIPPSAVAALDAACYAADTTWADVHSAILKAADEQVCAMSNAKDGDMQILMLNQKRETVLAFIKATGTHPLYIFTMMLEGAANGEVDFIKKAGFDEEVARVSGQKPDNAT